MASADRVTGIQGGANVNFSQAQILTGLAGVGGVGGNLTLRGGLGDTNHRGGYLYLYGGYGQGTGNGGYTIITGGNSGSVGGAGGGIALQAGAAAGSTPGYGGTVQLRSGLGHTGCGPVDIRGAGDSTFSNGGKINIYSGNGVTAGDLTLGVGTGYTTPGNLFIKNIPVAASNAGLPSGSVWINSTTRVLSVTP